MMKKTLLWTLLLAALLTLLCGAATAEPWAGSGTEADPWKITSAADLVALREYIAETEGATEGKFFLQTADISLSAYCGEGKGDWAPIGTHEGNSYDYHVFDGTYEGGGHSITGLYISNGGNACGLFSDLELHGSVSNLNVTGYVKGIQEVGGIVAHATKNSKIVNCRFTGTVKGTENLVGGIVGYLKGSVSNCHFSGTVTSSGDRVGGIAGITYGIASIDDCTVNGEISGSGEIGGITGYTRAPVSNCHFTGTVTGTGTAVGGIVGDGQEGSFITDCVSEGSINAYKQAGGIAGHCALGSVRNCTYLSGTVTGHDQIGGIIGNSNAEVIENCISHGTITGHVRVAGIAGETCGRIRGCENYGAVSGHHYSGGIAGHTWSALGYTGIVENCKNYGDVTVETSFVGGIVGGAEKRIIGCENHGKIKGDERVGGIVGDTESTISRCINDGEVIGNAYTGQFAGWSKSGANVTLKPNGGSGSEVSDMMYMAPACPFSHGSYAFFAWNTKADGSGDWYYEGDSVSADNGLPLYAIWMNSRKISYRRTDGLWDHTKTMGELRDGLYYLSGGWYAVTGNITLSERLMLSGDVNLVLMDVTTLNAAKGINVPEGCSLTIWGQGGDIPGVLNATGAADCAGIGGGKGQSGGTITINDGVVNATGGSYGAGIGGGDEGAGGTVTVNRGTVTARGKEGAAGIGAGDYGEGVTYTINGGSVTAIGSKRSNTGQASPGIGSGRPRADDNSLGKGGTMNFYGGTTVARSGGTDAGIGAYAVGVNYAKFTADAEQYGNWGHTIRPDFGTGMAATPSGADEPALCENRRLALMSGEVTIAPCQHPGQSSAQACKYCQKAVAFHEYLPHTTSGGSAYLIETSEDWDVFAWLTGITGLSTEGLTFRLANDVIVSTTVGSETYPFRGTFDGNGYTLFADLTASADGKGLFAHADGAAFTRLRVSGTITTNVNDTGGLVGRATGDCTISDCVSDIRIAANGGNGHAGFVGSTDGNVSITGSVFTGSIVGASASYCAGFAGAGAGMAEDCVYAGLISGNDNNNTFLRQTSNADNSYYTNLDGIQRVKGKKAVAVTAEEGVAMDFGTPKAVYPTSGITAYETGLMYNGVFYAGPDESVTLGLSALPRDRFSASAGTLVRSGGAWTLTLPDGDVVISAVHIPAFGTPDFTLPTSLTEVKEEAFEGIAASVVDVPEDCSSIGDYAFRNCLSLTQIRIPADCRMGRDVFDGCTLVYVYSAEGSQAEAYCQTHDNCVFAGEAQN